MFKELRNAPNLQAGHWPLADVREESVKECNLQHWHFVQKGDFNQWTLCRLYLTFESRTIFHQVTKETIWRNITWFRFMAGFIGSYGLPHIYNRKAQSRGPTKITPFGLLQRCLLFISSGFRQKLFLNSLYFISSKLPFSRERCSAKTLIKVIRLY